LAITLSEIIGEGFFMRAFKLCLFLLAAAVMCAAISLNQNKPIFEGGGNYTFFVGDTSKDCKIVTSSCPVISKLSLKNINGECAYYSNVDPFQLIDSLGGTIIFTEELSDSVNYYCSAPLPYSVELYGKTINLHVSVKADEVTAASPIIFGGY
jgi:hypothetical protein